MAGTGGAAVGEDGSAAGSVGYRGPSAARIDNSSPTGGKPESRLWWNDGAWWAVLYDGVREEYRIWRLDTKSQRWRNTGVRVDERNQSRADVLWNGRHLYVASHIFVNNGGSVARGMEARLYRFSYDTRRDRYRLDRGFPVRISQSKSEALVLEQDSTGKLWVTWVQGQKVWVNRTLGSDRRWGKPFVLPFRQATRLSSDDISAAIAFGRKRVGVMWSHQVDDAFYFAEHVDGRPDRAWTVQTVLQAPDVADDHINLKADRAGRVYAAVKTSLKAPTAPLTYLLVRQPATRSWTSHVVGTVRDRHTRPIVTLDERAGTVAVFATSPEMGGTIYRKASPLGRIAFGPGPGGVFIRDASSADMNDASSSKRPVSAATGLAVVASNDTTDFYWHNYDALVLDADFTAPRRSGGVPLTVEYANTSAGNPTSWSWDFGDGTTSTEENPRHTYERPGTYTVTLTVGRSGGTKSRERKTAYVNALPARVFVPTDDSWVRSTQPDGVFAAQPVLAVKANRSTGSYAVTYLRFSVTGAPRPVLNAKLRLWVADGGKDGGAVYVTDGAWSERTLTWATAPPLAGDPVGSVGPAAEGTWVEVLLRTDVFAAGDGVYAFAIRNAANDTVGYSSSEGTYPPQLVLAGPEPPVVPSEEHRR